MAFLDAFECPACGAAITGVSSLTRSLGCQHCGSWVSFNNHSWIDGGKFEHQIQAPPFLHVDRAGALKQRHFVVTGRLRLGYGSLGSNGAGSSGTWDEWWLEFEDGTGQWLEEDDGSYHLHEPASQDLNASSIKNTSVGQMINVNGQSWFVTEASEARLLGAEGQLPWSMTPGANVYTLDAVADGRELSIEVWDDEVVATTSLPLAVQDLHWD